MLLFLASCAYFKSKAVSSMSQMMLEKSSNLTKEASFENFKNSTPANLKLIESLHFIDPEDRNFISMLVKGHGAFAYSVYETLALKDKLDEKDYSFYKRQAVIHYTKSLEFGLKFLKTFDIRHKDLKTKNVASLLNKKFSNEDLVGLFYFAQSWGQLINSDRSNLYLISEITYVEQILNWVCAKNPLFEESVCDLYKAVFEAQKPRLMGGSKKRAEELFKAAIRRYPKNLLIRLSLMEYVLIPTEQSSKYYQHKKALLNDFYQWKKVLDYTRRKTQESESFLFDDKTNLYNAIAFKRFNIIKKYEDDFF